MKENSYTILALAVLGIFILVMFALFASGPRSPKKQEAAKVAPKVAPKVEAEARIEIPPAPPATQESEAPPARRHSVGYNPGKPFQPTGQSHFAQPQPQAEENVI